ncbi:NUDIX hydrolase [Verrucomicrobiales bacterium]|nr:NUDIX hydrolase [Verrucomicrobiales bacterium]
MPRKWPTKIARDFISRFSIQPYPFIDQTLFDRSKTKMHREPFLKLLAEYEGRHPEESDVVDRFRYFVSAHPDCFERSLQIGHLTGSAWVVNAAGDAVLLTHHRKLNIWVQPGGHADGETDILGVALKEADEETGLKPIEAISDAIFDLDIHEIPARKEDPAHFHYDVRFALQHSGDGRYAISEESHDLAWVSLDQLAEYTNEDSIVRMKKKFRATT